MIDPASKFYLAWLVVICACALFSIFTCSYFIAFEADTFYPIFGVDYFIDIIFAVCIWPQPAPNDVLHACASPTIAHHSLPTTTPQPYGCANEEAT